MSKGCCISNMRRSILKAARATRAAPPSQVEGNWVLYPPEGRAPEAVVHFLGGAFVGAAPQLAYRTLLEVRTWGRQVVL